MTTSTYVLVSTDPTNLVIIQGPFVWDGQTPYAPAPGTKTMLTSVALGAGYTYPAPDPSTVNLQTLQRKALTAFNANVIYLGINSPTAAQVTAQVASLTRQVNALIRLQLDVLDSTTGT